MIKKQAVVTIDGPSGTGKGTVCKLLATKLQWHFFDSGALYRVLALAASRRAISLSNEEALQQLGIQLNVLFEHEAPEGKTVIRLDNDDVTDAIRTESCGMNASLVAALPKVRQALLERQRAFAIMPGLVCDGRDMGTVVFPNAALKIYLDASIEERANRRYLQLKKNGNDASLAQVIEELTNRDLRDRSRSVAPLRAADDAIKIDTTKLTVDEVLEIILTLVAENENLPCITM